MKKLIVILSCLLATTAAQAAFAEGNKNGMIKECLSAYGYDYNLPVEQRVNSINWNGASACVSNFQVEQQKQKVADITEFLKRKPWFKGPNFKWEERAEYTCSKVYSSAHGVNITLCQKPYYLN